MLENQEPKPELTTDEKIAEAGLTELATTPIKPLLDVLSLEVKFFGYVENGWWTNDPRTTLKQELTHLNKAIVNLETDKQDYYSRLRKEQNKVTKLEEYLDENWDDIDEEVRDELCEIFDISAEITKTVNITITGTVEVTAPRGYDWDDIENALSVDVSVDGNSDMELDSFSVDDLEIQAD